MREAIYTFGPFQLRPQQGSLLRKNRAVRIGSRALAILTVLVERAGEVVGTQELVERVWPDTTVAEANLRVHLVALRKALRETGQDPRYIVNVPGQGYRFTAPVTRRAPPSAEESRATLPAVLTSLVGRAPEIRAIVSALTRRRFVTIVGAGGIGKTSTALSIANEIAPRYEDGVYFVDLTPLTDPELVPMTLAAALGLPVLATTHVSAIARHLRDRLALIVLDNCEHVVDSAATLVEALLKAAPRVHVLATSREPLGAEGEVVQRLSPLAVPPLRTGDADVHKLTARRALAFPAIQLFIERARATLDSFELRDADAPILAALCQKVGGIPLAIELAAARVDTLGIETLSAQLDHSLSPLARGRRTALPRHKSLRATLDWSFQLLTQNEQRVLARVSVFKMRFSLDGATAVASDDAIAANAVLDAVMSLCAKCLVVISSVAGVISYRLLDTTRVYAAEKLGASVMDARAARQRYCAYFIAVAQRLAEGQGKSGPTVMDEYRYVLEDVRAALDWAFSTGGDPLLGLELTARSAFLWFSLSMLDDYATYAERALLFSKGKKRRDAIALLRATTARFTEGLDGSDHARASELLRKIERAR
jgi:predicted ATPase/DNA-binding winged helix-turn-helix (wHTH) protein